MREYIRYFAADKGAAFSIEIAGKSWCDGSYQIFRKKSQVWVLEYILSGRGTIKGIDGTDKEYYPEEGDVYLLPVNRKHLYYSDAEEPWVKIWINCHGPVVDKLAEAYDLTDKILFRGVTELKEYFQEMYALMKDKSLPEKYVVEQTELLIHKIFRGLWERTGTVSGESDEVRHIKQYLDEHVGELVSIQELSELVFRSPDYVIKHFKAEVGSTPYQYLLKRKMSIAERLLCDTVLPVKEVATQLGYDDAHYFSGLFKKEKGLSPGAFRKNIHAEY